MRLYCVHARVCVCVRVCERAHASVLCACESVCVCVYTSVRVCICERKSACVVDVLVSECVLHTCSSGWYSSQWYKLHVQDYGVLQQGF